MFALSQTAAQRSVACEATRPRQKATARHTRARPIKYNASDRRHKPAVYKELPPPPPEVVVLSK
ncbi:MAG: plastid-specific ribosomal protein 6 [Monoraphidium minutum]|nr:MAG: plastid-specific ribosomal protein 6 [Monoraphidium minutum]